MLRALLATLATCASPVTPDVACVYETAAATTVVLAGRADLCSGLHGPGVIAVGIAQTAQHVGDTRTLTFGPTTQVFGPPATGTVTYHRGARYVEVDLAIAGQRINKDFPLASFIAGD